MNIAVYCGASKGNDKKYEKVAIELGMWMVKNSHSLVYGGGKIGLMGVLADTILKNNGYVTGVIPGFLFERELAHKNITKLIEVENMSQRKRKMADLSKAYIALPGGAGTLEEITEVISWSKMGIHQYPCILLDIDGFYTPLKDMYNKMIENGFMEKKDMGNIFFIDYINKLDEIIK